MAAEFSSDHGYSAAKALRGTKLELSGATGQHETWIKANNGSKSGRKGHEIWSVPMPGSNRDAAQLLYEIVTRGMSWRAK